MGLALADSETRMAQPLSTMERVNRNEDMRRLRELAREHGVNQIIVGLPLRLDGSRGEMAEEAERFAQRLRKQIGVPVEMVDERLTSWEAERLLEEVQGRFIHEEKLTGSKKPKNVQSKMSVDAVAAAVILKEYLDRQAHTADKA
jgi:putative Holliday junction resolvase